MAGAAPHHRPVDPERMPRARWYVRVWTGDRRSPTLFVRSQEDRMAIRVDVYTALGVARGVVARSGHLRDVLEAGGDLRVERATWQSLDDVAPAPAGELSFAM